MDLIIAFAVFLALVVGVMVWALCRRRPEPASFDLTAAAFVRWLDAGRPDLRLFLSWSEAEQIGLAALAREHRAQGYRALAAALRDVGDAAVDAELAALQNLAAETAGETLSMAGSTRRRGTAAPQAAATGPGPALFGRKPSAKEPVA